MRERRWAAAFLGLAGLATLASITLLASLQDPRAAGLVLAQAAAHALTGREASMLGSLALGTRPLLVGLVAASTDVAILGLGYALLGLGAGTIARRWIERAHAKARAAARDRFTKRTQAVGVAMLAAALWIPFLPGSALLATLVGRAAGYREEVLVPTLALSAIGADVAYALVAASFARQLPFLALGIATAIVLAGLVVSLLRTRQTRAATL